MPDLSGKELNKLWEVGAVHALYREDGKWFHTLKNFPGALFDKNGFIIFDSEKDYRNCKNLNINDTSNSLHVEMGISNIPGYIKVIEQGNIQNVSKYLIENPPVGNNNMARQLTISNRIVRNSNVTKFVRNLYNNHCQVCGTQLKLNNGLFYSEGHHILPLNKDGPDIINNVICVCPNCHVLLDYGAIKIDVENITIVPEHNLNLDFIKYHNEHIYNGM
jgi:5-methylcytosine-specific restriction protein A